MGRRECFSDSSKTTRQNLYDFFKNGMVTKSRYVRLGLQNKRARKRERDREERPMPRLGITVSFYKLNNYL